MATVLDLDCCQVDLERGTVTWPERTVTLTEVEARLLAYLAQHVGQAISRAELLQEVWGYSPKVRSRAVDQTMKRLRPKLEPDPKKPVTLQSAVGVSLREPGWDSRVMREIGRKGCEHFVEIIIECGRCLDQARMSKAMLEALEKDPGLNQEQFVETWAEQHPEIRSA